ncbi:hypothetical protein Tco_1419143 [Tanacetum coccineum]
MSKDQSIQEEQTKVDWHMANDDPILTTMREFIPKHETVQRYGAILPDTLTNQAMKESDAYKTYHDFTTGKVKDSKLKPKIVTKTKQDTIQSSAHQWFGLQMKELVFYPWVLDTDSDNDGDDFVHPNFSTHNEEERQDEEDKDEESSDLRVQKPSHFESTNDEAYDEVTQGDNVEGEELDEKETNEEEEVNDLTPITPTFSIRDVEVNLERRDINDRYSTDYCSRHSSFISNMLNPNLDIGIDFILNLNTESTILVDVPVTSNVEMPPLSMNETVKTGVQLQSNRLRDEAQAENENFINTLDENMRKIIKKQVKEQVKEQVSKILPKIKKLVDDQLAAEVLTRSSNQAKTSHVVAANLSELELKKIFIDKMENNKSIDRSIQ